MPKEPLTRSTVNILSILNLVVGTAACAFCLFALFIVGLQKFNVAGKASESMKILHQCWIIFMPIGLALGVILIVSGLHLRQNRELGRLLAKVAAEGAIFWFLAYTVYLLCVTNEYLIPFKRELGEPFHWVFAINSTILGGVLVLSYPIALLILCRRSLPHDSR